jgi:hypothetical protein
LISGANSSPLKPGPSGEVLPPWWQEGCDHSLQLFDYDIALLTKAFSAQ